MTSLRLVSLGGLLTLVALCYALSRDRRAVSWRLVICGLLLQFTLGGLFLSWQTGNAALQWFGEQVKGFLGLSAEGTRFVFGALGSGDPLGVEGPEGRPIGSASLGFIFATQVLPTVIFFSSFMSVLYHLGVMQVVVRGMAWVMARLLKTSGAESLSACGNVFVGQTEAPLMVRPFLAGMTKSELHAVMTGGFATIAGGVFAIYVGFGIDAGHLMVASVMAVPAGLVCSKLLWPETETSETMGRVVLHGEKSASNVVEAAAIGAGDGLKLALNVGAMLIAFLGLVAVANWLLGIGSDCYYDWFEGVDPALVKPEHKLSLDRILGWLFAPIASVMGVPWAEVEVLGRLLGQKLVLTELFAYQQLAGLKAELSPRTVRIASFALCGFANVGSVAIQIGGLGAIAPERRGDLSRLAFRAMFAGALATCMTACLAGVLAE
ncbi:MAG: NupC/NupG family nucleoside CNT transporter [Planctomycetes bacterium]|nr:NupC/NupG family nucleoside CNT transporter [Planctomycetota bacterium]